MVLRAIVFLCTSLFFANISAATPAESLSSGRFYLERNELSAAQTAFAGIPFGDALWKTKVEDLIRYHLLTGKPDEAWRLIQILKRVDLEKNLLGDYERLALFRAGACPLGLEAYNELHGLLLEAATFRYHQRYLRKDSESKVDAIEGASLATGLTPYLADIPKTKLLFGQGCRFAKAKLSSNTVKSAAKNELQALIRAQALITEQKTESSRAQVLLIARMIELSQNLGDTELKEELSASLPAETAINWLELPDPERRWVFLHYFKGTAFTEVPEVVRPRAQAIALESLKAAKDPKSSDWLALVDLNKLPPKERIAVLSATEKLGSFRGRAWVLFELARNYYGLGRTSESLTIMRRLLLEGEETVDSSIELALVDLASRIFGEHKHNAQLVGSVQAALPSRLWSSMVEGAIKRAAFAGRPTEFRQILKLRKTQSHSQSLSAKETDLWRNLASRDLNAFNRTMTSLDKGSGADRVLIAIAGQFASEMTAETFQSDKRLLNFARELGTELKKRIRPTDSRADQLRDFVQALDVQGAQEMGAKSTRQGIVNVGVARWNAQNLRPADFKLATSESIPLRELIYIPDRATGRQWQLSINPR